MLEKLYDYLLSFKFELQLMKVDSESEFQRKNM